MMNNKVGNILIGTITVIFVHTMISIIGLGKHDAAVYQTAIVVVLSTAYGRGAFVILGFIQTLLSRRQFGTLKIGLIEILTILEPFLLIAVTYYAQLVIVSSVELSNTQIIAAIVGAALTVIGIILMIWSVVSWPSLFVGHGVLKGQKLVRAGIYGRVRHPVYLAAFAIWLGC